MSEFSNSNFNKKDGRLTKINGAPPRESKSDEGEVKKDPFRRLQPDVILEADYRMLKDDPIESPIELEGQKENTDATPNLQEEIFQEQQEQHQGQPDPEDQNRDDIKQHDQQEALNENIPENNTENTDSEQQSNVEIKKIINEDEGPVYKKNEAIEKNEPNLADQISSVSTMDELFEVLDEAKLLYNIPGSRLYEFLKDPNLKSTIKNVLDGTLEGTRGFEFITNNCGLRDKVEEIYDNVPLKEKFNRHRQELFENGINIFEVEEMIREGIPELEDIINSPGKMMYVMQNFKQVQHERIQQEAKEAHEKHVAEGKGVAGRFARGFLREGKIKAMEQEFSRRHGDVERYKEDLAHLVHTASVRPDMRIEKDKNTGEIKLITQFLDENTNIDIEKVLNDNSFNKTVKRDYLNAKEKFDQLNSMTKDERKKLPKNNKEERPPTLPTINKFKEAEQAVINESGLPFEKAVLLFIPAELRKQYNEKASEFAKLPPRSIWDKSSKKDQEKFEKTKKEYEEAQNKILNAGPETTKDPQNINSARMKVIMNGLDTKVKLDQTIINNPDVEYEMSRLQNSKGWNRRWDQFLATVEGDKYSHARTGGISGVGGFVAERGLRAGLRSGSKLGISVFAGAAAIPLGAVAAVGIGAKFGWERGGKRANENIKKDEELVRTGMDKKVSLLIEKHAEQLKNLETAKSKPQSTKNDKEIANREREIERTKRKLSELKGTRQNFVDGNDLCKKLNQEKDQLQKLSGMSYVQYVEMEKNKRNDLDHYVDPKTGKRIKAKEISEELFISRKRDAAEQLKKRLEYTEKKLEEGKIIYGNGPKSLGLRFDLLQSMGAASAEMLMNTDLNKREIQHVITKADGTKEVVTRRSRLAKILNYAEDEINNNRNKYIKDEKIKGALTGGLGAFVGYGVGEMLHEHVPSKIADMFHDHFGQHHSYTGSKHGEEVIADAVKNQLGFNATNHYIEQDHLAAAHISMPFHPDQAQYIPSEKTPLEEWNDFHERYKMPEIYPDKYHVNEKDFVPPEETMQKVKMGPLGRGTSETLNGNDVKGAFRPGAFTHKEQANGTFFNNEQPTIDDHSYLERPQTQDVHPIETRTLDLKSSAPYDRELQNEVESRESTLKHFYHDRKGMNMEEAGRKANLEMDKLYGGRDIPPVHKGDHVEIFENNNGEIEKIEVKTKLQVLLERLDSNPVKNKIPDWKVEIDKNAEITTKRLITLHPKEYGYNGDPKNIDDLHKWVNVMTEKIIKQNPKIRTAVTNKGDTIELYRTVTGDWFADIKKLK